MIVYGWLRDLILISFFHKVAGGGLLSRLELWAKGGKRSWITPHNWNQNLTKPTPQNKHSQAPTESVLHLCGMVSYKNFFRLCMTTLGGFRNILEWHLAPNFFQIDNFSKCQIVPLKRSSVRMRTYARLQNWHFSNRAVLCGHGRDLWNRNQQRFRDHRFKNTNMADFEKGMRRNIHPPGFSMSGLCCLQQSAVVGGNM